MNELLQDCDFVFLINAVYLCYREKSKGPCYGNLTRDFLQ